MPLEMLRWQIAERFGWTLEYIDALSLDDLTQMIQIDDGLGKARAERNKPRGGKQ